MTLPNLDFISTREKDVLTKLKEAFPSVDLYVYERSKRTAKVEVYFVNDREIKEKHFYDHVQSIDFVEVPAMGQSLGIIHIILS